MRYYYLIFVLFCFTSYSMDDSKSAVLKKVDRSYFNSAHYKAFDFTPTKKDPVSGQYRGAIDIKALFDGTARVLVHQVTPAHDHIAVKKIGTDDLEQFQNCGNFDLGYKTFPKGVCLFPDQRLCFVVDEDGSPHVVTTDTMQLATRMKVKRSFVNKMGMPFPPEDLSANMVASNTIFGCNYGKAVSLFDHRTSEVVRELKTESVMVALALYYAKNHLISASEGALTVWDIGTGLPISSIKHQDTGARYVKEIALDQTNGTIFTNDLFSISKLSENCSEQMPIKGMIHSIRKMALSSDGLHLALVGERVVNGSFAELWNTREHRWEAKQTNKEFWGSSYSDIALDKKASRIVFQYKSFAPPAHFSVDQKEQIVVWDKKN
jgi:hypothetical protein